MISSRTMLLPCNVIKLFFSKYSEICFFTAICRIFSVPVNELTDLNSSPSFVFFIFLLCTIIDVFSSFGTSLSSNDGLIKRNNGSPRWSKRSIELSASIVEFKNFNQFFFYNKTSIIKNFLNTTLCLYSYMIVNWYTTYNLNDTICLILIKSICCF